MSLPDWQEEPIAKKHDRNSFDCGEPELNEFLKKHAAKATSAGAAKTFVAVDKADGKTILGFYSLCPAALEYARTPDVVRKGLARHDVPVFRLAPGSESFGPGARSRRPAYPGSGSSLFACRRGSRRRRAAHRCQERTRCELVRILRCDPAGRRSALSATAVGDRAGCPPTGGRTLRGCWFGEPSRVRDGKSRTPRHISRPHCRT